MGVERSIQIHFALKCPFHTNAVPGLVRSWSLKSTVFSCSHRSGAASKLRNPVCFKHQKVVGLESKHCIRHAYVGRSGCVQITRDIRLSASFNMVCGNNIENAAKLGILSLAHAEANNSYRCSSLFQTPSYSFLPATCLLPACYLPKTSIWEC